MRWSLLAFGLGFAAYELLGGGYSAGAAAMICVIVLFGFALALVALLVTLQRLMLWSFTRLSGRSDRIVQRHGYR